MIKPAKHITRKGIKKICLFFPEPEFKKQYFRNYLIIFAETPHKALTWRKENLIFLDKKYYNSQPDIIQKYTLLHELGHQFYLNESKADIFAINFLYLLNYLKREFIEFFHPDKNYLNHTQRKTIIYKYLKSIYHE
jgi:hypothetical protein